MDELPNVLTIKEVADYLRRSTKTIRRRINSGELKSYLEGNEYRFRKEWVLQYEEERVAGRDKTGTQFGPL